MRADSRVDVSALERLVQLHRRARLNEHLHLRMRLHETREDFGQQAVQRGVDRAKAQLTGGMFMVDEYSQVGQFPQQPARLGDDAHACRSRRDGAARARDERCTQFSFERTQLLRDRSRRHVHAPCGFRHRSGLDHQKKALQERGFHKESFA